MKILSGKVVSTKNINTLVVEVEKQRFHPLYPKIIRRSKRYKVQSVDKNVKVGDVVQIVSTRPISKDKHYKLLKVA